MNNLNAIWIILFTLTCLENSFAAKQDSPEQASLVGPRPQINVNQESGGLLCNFTYSLSLINVQTYYLCVYLTAYFIFI